MIVTVYIKPSCVQYTSTMRKLKAEGIEFELFDTTVDLKTLAVVEELGYVQRPIVVTDDDHWSGYRPDKIEELAHKIKQDAFLQEKLATRNVQYSRHRDGSFHELPTAGAAD